MVTVDGGKRGHLTLRMHSLRTSSQERVNRTGYIFMTGQTTIVLLNKCSLISIQKADINKLKVN